MDEIKKLLLILYRMTTTSTTTAYLLGASVALTTGVALYAYLSLPTPIRIPKRVILLRHGESEGNVDHHIYETKADNSIHLSSTGWDQAINIGKQLKKIIGNEESVRFFVSPYVRTRETLAGVAQSFGGFESMRTNSQIKSDTNHWSGSRKLVWTEDPRIREQDFGNYQNREAMTKAKKDRSRFSPFYYRFQGGESAADVFDRVSLFFASMYRNWHRKIGSLDNHNTILVCHGITIQIFFMRWFRYNVDEFCTYDNPRNCEAAVFEREYNVEKKKYVLKFSHLLLPDGTRENERRKRTYKTLRRRINLKKPLETLHGNESDCSVEITNKRASDSELDKKWGTMRA
jgi:broad specificity phosphatase PhoE